MNPMPQDDSLNLDSTAGLELGRAPAIQKELPDAEDEPVPEFHGTQRRCNTAERELLRQGFDEGAP